MTVNLGETRWRMLRMALEYDVFCFHDLRQPSRADVRHFDALLDLGLVAPAPPGATGTRRNTFRIKHRDPLGLFVMTEAGRKAAHMGFTPDVPEDAPKPSLTIERCPEGGKEGRDWNHAAAPPVPVAGTLYKTPVAPVAAPAAEVPTPPVVEPARPATKAAKPKPKVKSAKPKPKPKSKPKPKPKAAAR